MQGPTWMLAWWEAFKSTQDSLSVLVVRDEAGKLIGLVPWYRHRGFASGTTLRFLGDGRTCSDFQSLLCRPGYQSQVISCVIKWLTSNRESRWDLLDLEGISGSDPVMNAFIEAMKAKGHMTHVRPTEHTWRITAHGSWSKWCETFSKTQRGQLRNFLNRFEKGGLTFRVASQQEADVDRFIDEAVRLHQLRWHSAGRSGCFATQAMQSFFRSTMRAMIGEGSADIGLVERDGRAIAANVWLIRDGVAFGYQCGRDPEEEKIRIGRIAHAVVLRWLAENDFRGYDFLRGDEEYKRQMRAVPTACQRLRVVARATLPEWRHAIWTKCRDIKRWLAGHACH
ncbi:MAG: GNAT family N-acetyltransferase [Pirellulaceae bacterium]|nr:GNAT family N-acetyltransferase [Pirellulaceae bacterium]